MVGKEGVVVLAVAIEQVCCQLADVVANAGIAIVLRGVELQGVDPDFHGLTSDYLSPHRVAYILNLYCSVWLGALPTVRDFMHKCLC